jgi:RND family efflux transporter MFP subunit
MTGVDRCAWLLALALFSSACGEHAAETGVADEEAPAAPTCAIERVQRVDRRTLHGVIDTPPDRRASVAAEIPGRIQRVLVREGDLIESGALLAEIEAGPTSDAQAQARAHLAEAETLVHTQEGARDHLARLVERGIAPRAQLEEAEGHLAALREAATAARALASEARRGVSRTHVISPLGGTVLRLLRHPGETVDGTPATPIVEVADVSALELVASVAARDLLAISREQVAHVSVDGIDAPIEGVVRSVSPTLDPATGTGTVRVALTGLTRTLPLGLAAEAMVEVGTHEALVVPAEAVRSGAEGTTEVLICEESAAHPLAVTIGAREDGHAEITSAIDEHARLVARAIGLEDDAPCEMAP